MGIQDVIRFFLPREHHFYEFLERQAALAHQGATDFVHFGDGSASVADTLAAVKQDERDGDAVVRDMEEALAKTFVTPIDREDLHKLSSQLDDVLDLTYSSVSGCSMMGVTKPTRAMTELISVLAECTKLIAEAVPKLRSHDYHDIVIAARTVRERESAAGNIYRHAVSELFTDGNHDDTPARVLIREKNVLDDLDRAIDHCDTVANTLTNLAVKHG